MKKLLIGAGGGLFALTGALAGPILWTEALCRAEPLPQQPARILVESQDQRPEARTALVVAEWEIVYAYEDMARVIQEGDAHDFDYWRSISSFWKTLCAVRQEADHFGDPGSDSKVTVYTIAASFTAEMALKATYEETIGRVFALGGSKELNPQKGIEREMAQSYASFLHQTPWYLFPFEEWNERLQAAPIEDWARGYERRIALGGEWKAKAAYAEVIKDAVSTMAPDKTTMKVHVTGLEQGSIDQLANARLVSVDEGGMILDVDRYRVFTHLAGTIASLGGDFTEIAGNDDLLISILAEHAPQIDTDARILRQTFRQGAESDRFLVAVKVGDLADLIREVQDSPAEIEHIYDY